MYVRMLALPAAVRAKYDLSSMRMVASTGSPCPPEVKRAMIDWWGPVINECYGSSELGYMTLLTSEQALRKPGSAGAAAGVHAEDPGRRRPPAAQRHAGLIYIAPAVVRRLQLHRQRRGAPAHGSDGLKTMGDMGYLDDDGFLFIVDRRADMVISGGVNIYPVEIEGHAAHHARRGRLRGLRHSRRRVR
jgi:long-chain acyl-CoA synthetase